MTPDEETYAAGAVTSSPGLARLLAGGRHVRLLIAGQVPAELPVPADGSFERVARVVWAGQPGPVVVAAERLPFIEALFDRVLVTTPLPAATARAELREMWRVLAPAGLVLFVVKARRPWQTAGWSRERLEGVLEDAMFEVLDWQVETLPDRWHLVLAGKRDGLRPALIGRVEVGETVVAGSGV